MQIIVQAHSPEVGAAFSLVLALSGLDWIDVLVSCSSSSSSLTSSSSSCFEGSDFLGLSADLEANDSFVCWGAGLEPLGLVKNLLYRRVENQLAQILGL